MNVVPIMYILYIYLCAFLICKIAYQNNYFLQYETIMNLFKYETANKLLYNFTFVLKVNVQEGVRNSVLDRLICSIYVVTILAKVMRRDAQMSGRLPTQKTPILPKIVD